MDDEHHAADEPGAAGAKPVPTIRLRQGRFQPPNLASLLFLIVIVVVVVLWVMTMMRPPGYAPPATAVICGRYGAAGRVRGWSRTCRRSDPGATWKLGSPTSRQRMAGHPAREWLAHEGTAWPEYLGLRGPYDPVGSDRRHRTGPGERSPSGPGLLCSGHLGRDHGALHRGGTDRPPPGPQPAGRFWSWSRRPRPMVTRPPSAVDYLIDGAEFPSVVELVDGRIVQLDAVILEEGAFVLESRTLPRR